MIDILFDKEAKLGLLKRVSDGGGRKLSGYMKGKSKPSSFTIKLTYNDKFKIFNAKMGSLITLENVVVSDEGILFAIPVVKESTVVGRLHSEP